MKNFVYISSDFREAWKTYVYNINEREDWEIFDDSFKEEFDWEVKKEQEYLVKANYPFYLNDKLRKDKFLFNMRNDFYPLVDYQYWPEYENVDFTDLMLTRAKEMKDMDKEIDLVYSGGLDSASILWALQDVCPRDQINVIIADEECFKIYPKLYKDVISKGKFTNANGNLFGAADIKNNVFTTGCEVDILFGGTGYGNTREKGYSHNPNKRNKDMYARFEKGDPNDINGEEYKYFHNFWLNMGRYTFLVSSFRLLQNIKCDKFPIENFQPFYMTPPIDKFAINEHYEKKIVFQRNWCGDTEQFLKSKMTPRHFVANYDKEYAYTKHKTNMTAVVQSEMLRPLPHNFDLLAITGEGVCVNRKNILDFMDRKYLTMSYDYK